MFEDTWSLLTGPQVRQNATNLHRHSVNFNSLFTTPSRRLPIDTFGICAAATLYRTHHIYEYSSPGKHISWSRKERWLWVDERCKL